MPIDRTENDRKEPVGMAFPCEIDVKLFIINKAKTQSLLKDFIIDYLDEKQLISWRCRPSNGNKYLAVTVKVAALDRDHIDGLYRALSNHDRVLMVI